MGKKDPGMCENLYRAHHLTIAVGRTPLWKLMKSHTGKHDTYTHTHTYECMCVLLHVCSSSSGGQWGGRWRGWHTGKVVLPRTPPCKTVKNGSFSYVHTATFYKSKYCVGAGDMAQKLRALALPWDMLGSSPLPVLLASGDLTTSSDLHRHLQIHGMHSYTHACK